MAVRQIVQNFSGLLRRAERLIYIGDGARHWSANADNPSPPKKPLTPYIRFMQQNLAPLIKGNPTLTTGQIFSDLGKRWRNLSVETKQVYEQQFVKEVAEFKLLEEAWWNQLTDEQKHQYQKNRKLTFEAKIKKIEFNKGRKKIVELGKPAYNRCSWNFFMKEKMASAKGSSRSKLISVSTESAKEWNLMSIDEKQKYVEMADKDRERYNREIAIWKLKMMQEGYGDLVHLYFKRKKGQKLKQ